ncbi:hypothetical protein OSTOST_17992, partial [Ostertagia ostertagi]
MEWAPTVALLVNVVVMVPISLPNGIDIKCYRIGEFNALTEIRTNFPNLFRISKLIFTCFIIFHWNGCLYFFISVVYDFP